MWSLLEGGHRFLRGHLHTQQPTGRPRRAAGPTLNLTSIHLGAALSLRPGLGIRGSSTGQGPTWSPAQVLGELEKEREALGPQKRRTDQELWV